jgi:1-phosphatidylinositol-4-phosphate 5-kinase
MDDGKLIINEDIKVTEYAPDVFAFLRQKDGYSNEVLRQSLNPEANKKMVFKAGESQGKSGSFFFFSQDQQFIIKTMTEEDFDAFTRIQKKYF